MFELSRTALAEIRNLTTALNSTATALDATSEGVGSAASALNATGKRNDVPTKVPLPQAVATEYQETLKTTRWHADTRIKLLGFVPLTTAAGVILTNASDLLGFESLFIATIGLIATLGFSMFDLWNWMGEVQAIGQAGGLREHLNLPPVEDLETKKHVAMPGGIDFNPRRFKVTLGRAYFGRSRSIRLVYYVGTGVWTALAIVSIIAIFDNASDRGLALDSDIVSTIQWSVALTGGVIAGLVADRCEKRFREGRENASGRDEGNSSSPSHETVGRRWILAASVAALAVLVAMLYAASVLSIDAGQRTLAGVQLNELGARTIPVFAMLLVWMLLFTIAYERFWLRLQKWPALISGPLYGLVVWLALFPLFEITISASILQHSLWTVVARLLWEALALSISGLVVAVVFIWPTRQC